MSANPHPDPVAPAGSTTPTEAGPEMDLFIAEKVMDATWNAVPSGAPTHAAATHWLQFTPRGVVLAVRYADGRVEPTGVWVVPYSSDDAVALVALRKMGGRVVITRELNRWTVKFDYRRDGFCADTFALAICLAIVDAVALRAPHTVAALSAIVNSHV